MTFGYRMHPGATSTFSTKDASRVREQLDKVLSSHHFAQSKRYPTLLSHIVEKALSGQTNLLKERIIGIEVFGRIADYETSDDPIVRVSAAEIRKRLAQYYQDPGHQEELRIELRAGSYVPEFFFADRPEAPPEKSHVPAPVFVSVPPPSEVGKSRRLPHRWLLATGAILAVLVVAASVIAVTSRQDGNLVPVWRPILKSSSPVVISVLEQAPDQLTGTANEGSPSLNVIEHQRLVSSIHFSEVQALARIINFLEDHRHPYRLQTAKTTTYSDLQQGPAILIGAIGNPWTIRALQPLRYRFARDDEHQLYWVEDQKYPQSRKWIDDMSQPYSTLNQDFAIVARFVDPETRQPVIILAGIGENGTRAASEFLTDREDLRNVDSSILSEKLNFEIVIRTQVINGISGPPQVVAVQTW